MLRRISILVFSFSIILSSCAPKVQVTGNTYSKYQMKGEMPVDSVALKMIQPYHDSLSNKMDLALAENENELVRTQPEGTLGNFIADALLKKGIDYAYHPIDFSIVNNGGIRLPSLPAGNISVGKIYELMPFDNMVVVLKIKGSIVQQLMNIAADKGGWPVAGMKYSIHEKLATNIFIQQSPLDTNKIYTMISSDYLANGGDNCIMLKGQPQEQLNVLFRDLLITDLQELKSLGKKIELPSTGRIISE